MPETVKSELFPNAVREIQMWLVRRRKFPLIASWQWSLHNRDDFFCSDSSLACSFLPQGWFLAPGFIPGLLFSSAGMISSARIHLYLALFFRRDDFFHPVSSLACSFLPQGWFLPSGFIPSLLFSSTGMISSSRIHPWTIVFACRDASFPQNASLTNCFSVQRLLRVSSRKKESKNLVFSTFTTAFVESTRFLKRCRQRESNPHSVARTGF